MKATFFLGRIHHAYKLLPVAAALEQADTQIEFLICDNSINIDPATEYLPLFNIVEFRHARDYLPDYSSVNSMAGHSMNYAMSKLSSYVPPFWIASAIREAAVDYHGFDKYFEIERPNLVFALHEQNFFVKILFALAKKHGIRTYSLMEGVILEREEEMLGKYSSGTEYTDTLFSWSEYDKQFYSDPDKIFPVGPTHLDEWLNIKQNNSKWQAVKEGMRRGIGIGVNDSVLTFAPPRLDLYRGDFSKALDELSKWTRNLGIKLIIKLHPFQSEDIVYGISNRLKKYNHVVVTNDNNSIKFLVMADAVITQTSTVAMEAIALDIPLIEIDLDYYGLEQSLAALGAATLLEGNNFDAVIRVLNGGGDAVNLAEFKEERLSLADGNSIKRITDYIRVNQWIR